MLIIHTKKKYLLVPPPHNLIALMPEIAYN